VASPLAHAGHDKTDDVHYPHYRTTQIHFHPLTDRPTFESGLFTDLLLVRWSLVLAYLFFCINIALAFPAWGNWGFSPNPVLCIGQLAFALASMLIQVCPSTYLSIVP